MTETGWVVDAIRECGNKHFPLIAEDVDNARRVISDPRMRKDIPDPFGETVADGCGSMFSETRDRWGQVFADYVDILGANRSRISETGAALVGVADRYQGAELSALDKVADVAFDFEDSVPAPPPDE